jgi:hypothetical protein
MFSVAYIYPLSICLIDLIKCGVRGKGSAAEMDECPVCRIPRAELQSRPVYKVPRAEIEEWCKCLCAPTTESRGVVGCLWGFVLNAASLLEALEMDSVLRCLTIPYFPVRSSTIMFKPSNV